MPRAWNDTTDRQLLLIIIRLTASHPPKWDQVADLMGDGFTADSTRMHFRKLRQDCDTKLEGCDITPCDAGTMERAPRKPKASKTSHKIPSTSTGKRKDNRYKGTEDDAKDEGVAKKIKVEERNEEDT